MSYGGFLPLELGQNEEYFLNYSTNIVKLNSGRSALKYILLIEKPKKIYIPLYICESIIEVIKISGVEFEYYKIDSEFMPMDVELDENECILWVNYFGIMEKKKIDIIKNKYKNIIFDNTQGFYIKPIIDFYNIYSCRKFFGVCDGAYLIKENIKKISLNRDYSCERALFLLTSLERGTNSSYEMSIENEELIGKEILAMSYLTERIMGSINFETIKKIRIENFNCIHKRLKDINELTINNDNESALYYPLLIKKDGIKEKLIKNDVYVPTLWRHLLAECKDEDFEYILSKYLICLPIDQRYCNKDINEMLDILEEIINEFV